MTSRLIAAADIVPLIGPNLGGMAVRQPAVFDNFDAADGTALSGRITPSGQTWYSPAGGEVAAVIYGGAMTSDANTYSSLDYGALIPRISATFSWSPAVNGDGNRSNASFAFMGGQNNASTLINLLHLQFTPDVWTLEVTTTGASGLTGVGYGSWKLPLTTDGAAYSAAMEFDYVNQVVILYGPDGSVTPIEVVGLGSTYRPTFGIWQITSLQNFRLHYHSVSMGTSLAQGLVASGFAAPMSPLAELYGTRFTRRAPFSMPLFGASGNEAWFRIATGQSWGVSGVTSGAAINGRVRLSADDGRYSWNDWEFDCGATTQGNTNPALSQRRGFLLNSQATPAVDKARLSKDFSGNLALDVHVAGGLSPSNPVTISGEFEGYFTRVVPTINAAPLGAASTILDFVGN